MSDSPTLGNPRWGLERFAWGQSYKEVKAMKHWVVATLMLTFAESALATAINGRVVGVG